MRRGGRPKGRVGIPELSGRRAGDRAVFAGQSRTARAAFPVGPAEDSGRVRNPSIRGRVPCGAVKDGGGAEATGRERGDARPCGKVQEAADTRKRADSDMWFGAETTGRRRPMETGARTAERRGGGAVSRPVAGGLPARFRRNGRPRLWGASAAERGGRSAENGKGTRGYPSAFPFRNVFRLSSPRGKGGPANVGSGRVPCARAHALSLFKQVRVTL